MIADIFWNVATSNLALGVDGLLLLAALAVGWIPLGKYLPVIGPYVPVARLVAVLLALLMCFLLGFRVADEREAAKNLRAELAAKQADLDIAAKSVADATNRATEIEKAANAQHQADVGFIATLILPRGCGFEPFPRRVWDSPAPAGVGALSAGGPRQPDEAAAGAGSGYAMPFSLVRHRWLQGERP